MTPKEKQKQLLIEIMEADAKDGLHKQQTAIEYFDEHLQEYVIAQDTIARKLIIEISFEDYMNLKKQAKEMEKKQILKAYNKSFELRHNPYEIAEKYYNETYGKQEKL